MEATWTTYKGSPVYWLAPEFWTPAKGAVCLVLPGEDAHALSLAIRKQRITEFLTLQGDTRYCTAKDAKRMRRLMSERLGTETPWRGTDPKNVAEHTSAAHIPTDRSDLSGAPF